MNTGGPASEKTLRDEFAGQALPWCLSEFAGNPEDGTQYAPAAYQIAEAMLAEKARREWQMKSAMEKPGVVECVAALCRDHSGDANKMAELQAANKELVEALRTTVEFTDGLYAPEGSVMRDELVKATEKARATLAKHKGAA